MNKETIKRRWASVKNLFYALTIKARYRSVYAIKYIARRTRSHLTSAGVCLARMVKSAAITAFSGIKKIFINTMKDIVANKRKVALGAVCCVAVAFCGASVFNAVTAYQYSYDGEVLGVVDKPSNVYDGIEIAEKTLTEQVGAQVVIDEEEDIQVTRVIKNNETGTEEDVVDALTSIEEIKVLTQAITITSNTENGIEEQQIHIDTLDNANQVLEAVKSSFYGKHKATDFAEISFVQNVQIKETKAMLEEIVTTTDAIELILTGGTEESVYKVKKGDNLDDICKEYGVKKKDVKKWNEGLDDEKSLQIGQEIHMIEQIPLIDVITKRNTTFTEDYGPEIEYEDTDNLYKDMEIVTKEGKSGNRTVNADIIEKNGERIERIDHSYTVHKEQETSTVLRGTKERPEKIGKGHYFYPMDGGFSSPFGKRWGRLHAGIDIRGPIGTDVHAADAGIVTESGPTSNGYGIAIRIDHGNGRSTYYAHNSKVLVKVGETVYRGQHIAESGNTGNSTGPHLHFETHFNGVPKNPMKYL